MTRSQALRSGAAAVAALLLTAPAGRVEAARQLAERPSVRDRPAVKTTRPLPSLTASVNDFAQVISPSDEAALNETIHNLQQSTGDVIVVAAVPTIEPYANIQEYSAKLFENGGRGIGQKGRDNGLLVVLALKERTVWIQVGNGLEPWITNIFASETSQDYMRPEFRSGRYGAGLVTGVTRLAARVREGRGAGVAAQPVRETPPATAKSQAPPATTGEIVTAVAIVLIFLAGTMFVVFFILRRLWRGLKSAGRAVLSSSSALPKVPPVAAQDQARWSGGNWSGWSSGVGPFGGSSFPPNGFDGVLGGFGRSRGSGRWTSWSTNWTNGGINVQSGQWTSSGSSTPPVDAEPVVSRPVANSHAASRHVDSAPDASTPAANSSVDSSPVNSSPAESSVVESSGSSDGTFSGGESSGGGGGASW